MGVIRGLWTPVFTSPRPSTSQKPQKSQHSMHTRRGESQMGGPGKQMEEWSSRGLRKQKPGPALQKARGSPDAPDEPPSETGSTVHPQRGAWRGHRSVVCNQQLDPTAIPAHPHTPHCLGPAPTPRSPELPLSRGSNRGSLDGEIQAQQSGRTGRVQRHRPLTAEGGLGDCGSEKSGNVPYPEGLNQKELTVQGLQRRGGREE